jgi:hypothetical protein
MLSRVRPLVPLALGLCLVSCDFQPDPPPGPSALPGERVGEIKGECRQPKRRENADAVHCNDLVWFFGSWMHPGEELPLERVPGSFTWAAVAKGVPVNWPPVASPHLVRVFDPHLTATPTEGVTASRLVVGGQGITEYDSAGTPQESGLIYVDDNGVGRSPL